MNVTIIDLAKSYHDGEMEHIALKGITCEIPQGSMVCIIGNSGSGKTTLLNIISGIMEPNLGIVLYDDHNVLTNNKRDFRLKKLGYLGQYPDNNLFLNVSIKDNFIFLLDALDIPKRNWSSLVNEKLSLVGLSHLPLNTKCRVLSGGELQRLALALTLLNDPELILADEPTGNLDYENAKVVLSVLSKYVKGGKKSVIIASHDPLIQKYSDVTYRLTDGRISAVYKSGVHIPVDEYAERIPLFISRGGTLTLPDSFMENLPDTRLVHAEIEGDKVILYFGSEGNE